MDTANGTVTCADFGQCEYVSDADYVGPDSFDYTVADDSGASDSGHVTITVAPNQAPEAEDDTYARGDDITLRVLANDFDPEEAQLEISAVTQPAHGTATITLERTRSPTRRPRASRPPTRSPTRSRTGTAVRIQQPSHSSPARRSRLPSTAAASSRASAGSPARRCKPTAPSARPRASSRRRAGRVPSSPRATSRSRLARTTRAAPARTTIWIFAAPSTPPSCAST